MRIPRFNPAKARTGGKDFSRLEVTNLEDERCGNSVDFRDMRPGLLNIQELVAVCRTGVGNRDFSRFEAVNLHQVSFARFRYGDYVVGTKARPRDKTLIWSSTEG